MSSRKSLAVRTMDGKISFISATSTAERASLASVSRKLVLVRKLILFLYEEWKKDQGNPGTAKEGMKVEREINVPKWRPPE